MSKQISNINYKKDTVINTVSQIVYLFVLWLMTIITPRLGNSVDAGIFTIALSVANICTALATYSINFYVASDIKKKFNNQHYLCFGLTSTSLSILVAFIISLSFGYYKDPIMFWAVILFYIYKCAENITLIIAANMQRVGKLYISGYALLIKAVTSLLIFTLTLYFSKNIVLSFGLLAIFAVLYLVFVDYQLLKKYTKDSYKFDKEIYKASLSIFILALPLFIYGISFAAIGSFPRIVLEKFASKEVVGYFGTMAAITSVIQSGISALFIPFLPKLAEMYQANNKKYMIKMLLIFIGLIMFLTGVVFLSGCYLDKWFLSILYPKDKVVLDYAHYFKWIILVGGLQALVIVVALTLVALRRLRHVGLFSLIGLILMFSLSFLLISKYLLEGAIYVFVIGYGIMFLLMTTSLVVYLVKNNSYQCSKNR